MLKQPALLLFSSLLLVSVFAFQPKLIQEFLVMPRAAFQFTSQAWHIGDDIVAFYQTDNMTQGYLKISHETNQVGRVLTETFASCQGDHFSFLDPSYYHPLTSTFLFYCRANNSLLTIGQNFTVQDAIPISTSRTFEEVILGHNEQGFVTILGLPDLMTFPATFPTELIIVDLKNKAVENHVIFNQGSDSDMLVTGYAVDSTGASYILQKSLPRAYDAVIRISKMVLNGNDYDLTPIAKFTSYDGSEYTPFYHVGLHIVGDYLFTNDNDYLVIYDKNGKLYQRQYDLEFQGFQKPDTNAIFIPYIGALSGGSALYAATIDYKTRAYSVKNGKMTPTVLDDDASHGDVMFAFGDLTGGDWLMNASGDTFFIKDIKTNATLYTSFGVIDDIIVTQSHYGVLNPFNFYVFNRTKSGQLLKTIPVNAESCLDKPTGLLVNFETGCQVTYTDVETLKKTNGPTISKAACSKIRHVNLTDLARPFFISNPIDRDHWFISPATYGEAQWKCPNFKQTEGIVVAGDNGETFYYVWNPYANASMVNIDTYKLNKGSNSWTIQSSYPLTTDLTHTEDTKYSILENNLVVLSHDETITIIDPALKTFKTYDAPKIDQKTVKRDVGLFFDENKKPYVSLAEVQNYWTDPNHTPLLIDFDGNVTTLPGVTNLTKTATVIGNCSYALTDEYVEAIGILRIFDTCSQEGQRTEKITF